MKPLYSHPNVQLTDHLLQVGQSSRTYVLRLPKQQVPKELLADVAYLCGALHDFGKATNYFQCYLLLATSESVKLGAFLEKVGQLKSHALLSAVLVRKVVKQYLEKCSDLSEGQQKLLTAAAFVAVRKHHAHLPNVKEAVVIEKQSWQNILKPQLKEIKDEQAQELLEAVLAPAGIFYSWPELKQELLAEVEKEDTFGFNCYDLLQNGEWFSALPQAQKLQYYYLIEYLFAALLLADKQDVKQLQLKDLPVADYKQLQIYRQKKGHTQPSSSLNCQRQQAYEQTLEELEQKAIPAQHFYSLTLPTGMGKTLLSLAVAIRLREQLQLSGRLVFTIPFTSIIDQSFKIFEDIFTDIDSRLLLKHHHLSNLHYRLAGSGEELEPEQCRHLIETWQSAVVVSTFVQLFESLIGNNKSRVLKLPQLIDSVVVLDEVQQVPYEYWLLIRTALQAVARCYNCYFVFTTATQPLLLHNPKAGEEEGTAKVQELVPNHPQYYHLFNRTKLVLRQQEEISLQAFAEEVADYLKQNREHNVLVILNTKKLVLDVFDYIKKAVEEHQPELVKQFRFLSTYITPYERKQIINELKDPERKQPIIVVSTQLVEAGVDFSVEAVFRQFAPLPSIVQAAGRANRNMAKNFTAPVFIYSLENQTRVNGLIYGSIQINTTRSLLHKYHKNESICETDYLGLIDKYAQLLAQESISDTKNFCRALKHLDFAEAGEFRLIENREMAAVFVLLDPQARQLWEQYQQLLQKKITLWERRNCFAAFRARFYDYVINIETDKAASLPLPEEGGFLLLDPQSDSHQLYYHYQLEAPHLSTGFSSNSPSIFFC